MKKRKIMITDFRSIPWPTVTERIYCPGRCPLCGTHSPRKGPLKEYFKNKTLDSSCPVCNTKLIAVDDLISHFLWCESCHILFPNKVFWNELGEAPHYRKDHIEYMLSFLKDNLVTRKSNS